MDVAITLSLEEPVGKTHASPQHQPRTGARRACVEIRLNGSGGAGLRAGGGVSAGWEREITGLTDRQSLWFHFDINSRRAATAAAGSQAPTIEGWRRSL